MKVNLKDLLWDADKNGYAIPAFNYSDVWEMFGILDAALEENAPVMLATNAQVSSTFGIPYLAEQALHVIRHASIPIVHHLDHCWDKENCKLAMDSGYDSVMIDGSHLLLEENIALCREIVEYAGNREIAVEGEIGRIRGKSAEGTYDGEDFLGDVDESEELVRSTGVTSLAVGIGNAHGFYIGEPAINFRHLKEINDRIQTPLVLHGGTGIPEEDIRKCISLGINKVNVGTHLHSAYLNKAREELTKKRGEVNIVNIFSQVRAEVKQEVKKWIRICMAENRA